MTINSYFVCFHCSRLQIFPKITLMFPCKANLMETTGSQNRCLEETSRDSQPPLQRRITASTRLGQPRLGTATSLKCPRMEISQTVWVFQCYTTKKTRKQFMESCTISWRLTKVNQSVVWWKRPILTVTSHCQLSQIQQNPITEQYLTVLLLFCLQIPSNVECFNLSSVTTSSQSDWW